jgi:hypothetical protein
LTCIVAWGEKFNDNSNILTNPNIYRKFNGKPNPIPGKEEIKFFSDSNLRKKDLKVTKLFSTEDETKTATGSGWIPYFIFVN